ncbi:MAG: RNA polymerase-binding protein DksA [Magnetococcales bacterium]|nr:RNA polymerase-binding protein DksA [Magnetococcales bacterium]MBF0605157.1 RNA polymerase-binding protein DksA [Magnetococcales bacterium]HAT49389.1 RNA polymerase-binding protein DksA [Alphaproteobacteria bacterium]
MTKIADIVLPEGYRPSEDETYMAPQQRAFFYRLLAEWRRQLLDDATKTVAVMTEEKAAFADPADRATLETDRNFELRTRDRERKLISKIERTMETIEADDYGYCEECGVEIGLRRLEARPVTDQCISCKTRAEHKERVVRSFDDE